jgi:hypothetical protein
MQIQQSPNCSVGFVCKYSNHPIAAYCGHVRSNPPPHFRICVFPPPMARTASNPGKKKEAAPAAAPEKGKASGKGAPPAPAKGDKTSNPKGDKTGVAPALPPAAERESDGEGTPQASASDEDPEVIPLEDDRDRDRQSSGDDSTGRRGEREPPDKASPAKSRRAVVCADLHASRPSPKANNKEKLIYERKVVKHLEDKVGRLEDALRAATSSPKQVSPAKSRPSGLGKGRRERMDDYSDALADSPSRPKFKHDGKADCTTEPWKTLFASAGDCLCLHCRVFCCIEVFLLVCRWMEDGF